MASDAVTSPPVDVAVMVPFLATYHHDHAVPATGGARECDIAVVLRLAGLDLKLHDFVAQEASRQIGKITIRVG